MSRTIEERLRALEDVQAIANLKARYLNSGDGGWDGPSHDAEALAPLIAPDFSWTGPRFGTIAGPETALDLWRQCRSSLPFAYHVIANPLIETEGDVGSGEWHVLWMATDAEGRELWSAGVYSDTFVRTPDGWKIQSVSVRHAFSGPYSDGWAVRTRAIAEEAR